MRQIVLASSSPRRQELIKKLNIPFIVDSSNFKEYFDFDKTPEELTVELSLGKAEEVAKRHPQDIILAADTFVVLNGRYIGKPKDRKDAEEMLFFQSEKMQKVVTGFTIIDGKNGKVVSKPVVTNVYFKKLTKSMIKNYLDKNTYLDKAGAYGIQDIGEKFISKIEGDYDNVMGFPTQEIITVITKEFQLEI
ncbi:MAG TPA: nucleoside triphosphate pyrophosphatase [Patescibacteria group bacterium]